MIEYVKIAIEFVFSCCLLINAALFIPQAISVYKAKSSRGVSIITFAGFNIIQIVTILHAYINNDPVLMYGTFPSLIFSGILTCLIIYYRNND